MSCEISKCLQVIEDSLKDHTMAEEEAKHYKLAFSHQDLENIEKIRKMHKIPFSNFKQLPTRK